MLRHQADIKEDTIARPVCLLKRARVGALSEGNMVEATRVMRKVQPFRVDCTLCFEEWFTDGWQCSNLKNQETHAEAPEPNLPITGNFIDVAW